MDFIYRLPLMTMDIEQQEVMENHYAIFLDAVKLSSPSFYLSIKDKKYAQLDKKQKLKLLKYVLRGKYRATPFGRWSGTGVGTAGKADGTRHVSYKEVVDCTVIFKEYESKSQSPDYKYHGSFRMVPLIFQLAREYIFWEFDMKELKWEYVAVHRNSVLDKVYSYLSEFPYLNYSIFQKWAGPEVTEQDVKKVWDNIIRSGILLPVIFPNLNHFDHSGPSPDTAIVDSILQSNLQPAKTSLKYINQLLEETGNLVRPSESRFIREFKKQFIHRFDDRLVPFKMALHPKSGIFSTCIRELERLPSDFNRYPDHPVFTAFSHYLAHHKRTEGIDLSQIVEKKPIECASEVGILYRTLDNGVFIDHIGYGKSLGFIGRFSHAAAIRTYGEKLIKTYYNQQEILYADFELYESPEVQRMARHEKLLDYMVTLNPANQGPNYISPDDLWIGIRGDKTVLFDKKRNKEVIPIILHALNPRLISHPISKMLWECSLQYHGQGYFDPLFRQEKPEYFPRISWGKSILKAKSLRINQKEVTNKEKLVQKLLEHGFSNEFVYGNYDQELVIDVQHPHSLEIFFNDLQKAGELVVQECPWVKSSYHMEEGGSKVFPQFLVSLPPKKPKTITPIAFGNKVYGIDEQWVYLKVYFNEHNPASVLMHCFWPVLLKVEKEFGEMSWFYLYYIDHDEHLRIRIKVSRAEEKEIIATKIILGLNEFAMIRNVGLYPYLPETEKFGTDTISLSQELFCLESRRLVGDGGEGVSMVLDEVSGKLKSAVSITIGMLEALELKEVFLKKYTVRLKDNGIGYAQKKKFKSFYDLHIKSQGLHPLKDRGFESQYLKLAEAIRAQCSKGQFEDVLDQHLHLFYNRLMMQWVIDTEPIIWYCVRCLLDREKFGEVGV